MRHLTARENGSTGGWHFVSLNRRTGGYPIGFCGDHEPHATEAAARECFTAYLRSQVRLDVKSSSWHGCDVKDCDKPTKTHAEVPGYYRMAALCDEHLTLEHALEPLGLTGPSGDGWIS